MNVKRIERRAGAVLLWVALIAAPGALALDVLAQTNRDSGAARSTESRRERKPQPRPNRTRVAVPLEKIRADDGDTIDIAWNTDDVEIVRILGIDTPETQHPDHNLPYGQPFGEEARGFAKGVFAAAQRVELLRTPELDPYGRTLGYLFVNGMNYSVLVVRAHLAEETVSHYGDNGFPREAAEVLAAAKAAGPVPFEAPHLFRQRMRAVSEAMRKEGRRD